MNIKADYDTISVFVTCHRVVISDTGAWSSSQVLPTNYYVCKMCVCVCRPMRACRCVCVHVCVLLVRLVRYLSGVNPAFSCHSQ